MKTVTGQKSEVLELAEKIVELCREYTSSDLIATAATEIAGKVIVSEWRYSSQLPEEPALSRPAA